MTDTPCCCVIEDSAGIHPCPRTTSGPDDPFCAECTARHGTHWDVIQGTARVTARLPTRGTT